MLPLPLFSPACAPASPPAAREAGAACRHAAGTPPVGAPVGAPGGAPVPATSFPLQGSPAASGAIPAFRPPSGGEDRSLEALRGDGTRWPLWRAGQRDEPPLPTVSSGWPALDAELPGGGWPLQGLVELLAEPAGGELSLLAPGLQALVRRALGPRELLWVAPPARPCVAALQALGLPPSRLVCVEPASAADAAWAAEQALRAGSCAAVLWWHSGPCAIATLRRLHLAAQAGATPLVAVRPPALRAAGSPAPLRLACSVEAGRRLAVEVFKRRGPPMAAPLTIALPWPAAARRLATQEAGLAREPVEPGTRAPSGLHARKRPASGRADLRPLAAGSTVRLETV